MKIRDYSMPSDKISHLLQIPMDLFFCNYFHKLYPEDIARQMDVVFFGQNKEELYKLTRELMLKEGLIENKSPLFVLMKNFPYLLYNGAVPEWNMDQREIKEILLGYKITKEDTFTLFRYLEDNSGNIRVRENGATKEFSYAEFCDQFKRESADDLVKILAENIYLYLQDHKKKYVEESGEIEESILSVSDKKDVRNIGAVLKSTIALEILLLSDGTRNTTKIAKELNKSVATISTYVNRLKKLHLVRLLPNGLLRRNIKGVKVNLELGV